MTKQEFEKFLDELGKIRKMVCKHAGNDCDHNRCMASINSFYYGCYGDECAFDAVIEAVEQLERESN